MSAQVSKTAGSFLGGITNNPGAVIILIVIAAIVLFRNDIRGAFAGLGNIQLPAIKLPEIQLPSLPEIQLPSLPSLPEGGFQFPQIQFPDIFNIFGPPAPEVMPMMIREPLGLEEFGPPAPGQARIVDEILTPEGGILQTPTSLMDFINRILPTRQLESITIAPSIQSEAGFMGGGPSFIGGTIFETPIERLSLSQIIDRFGVSASRAASIRAEAQGFTPEEESFLMMGMEDTGPVVSDIAFAGLSPEEIFSRLVGGNINRFGGA